MAASALSDDLPCVASRVPANRSRSAFNRSTDGLLLTDQVHQPRRVTAADLAAAGDSVRRAEQQPGQKADQRNTHPPRRGVRRLATIRAVQRPAEEPAD